jgi:hypothetical protein
MLAAIGLTLTGTSLFAQTVTPREHYQCYAVLKADPLTLDIPVRLRDQFGVDDVDVVRARRFCNPTRKFHRNQFQPVQDIRRHLTFYATFPQSSPLRLVQISNQFDRPGTTPPTWRVREAVSLAVPTQKPPHDRPEDLDHYRCYAANGNPVFEGVGLADQFQTAFMGHFVLDPVLFCNPVQKTRLDTGETSPVFNRELHLACYSMTRVPFERTQDVANQFGRQTFALGPPDTLCVPTRKLAVKEIPDVTLSATDPEIEALAR